jgi:UDP-glucose 4-epimerase
MGKRVLITHLAWFLSHRLANRLEDDPDVEYILGVDTNEPRGELHRTEYLQADIRKPVVMKILDSTGIDTVIHMGLFSTPAEAGGRGAMHDLNVIGAMQLFAACQRSKTVKQVIVRSSTAVYGADANDPAVFTEEMARSARTDPFGRDSVEMESYARELRRRRRDLDMNVFRFANIIGPGADTPLSRYLTMGAVPTVLGFDPRLQFIHEDDATDLLARAIERPVIGTYNAAGDGVLFLSQVLRMGGRLQLPMPAPILNASGPLFRFLGRGLQVPPHILQLIQWGRIADNRRLKEDFGFIPRYTTRDAVREFYAERRLRRVAHTRGEQQWERELHDFLTRKGQERFMERARVRTDTSPED